MTEQEYALDKLKAARDFAEGNTTTDYLLVHKRASGPEVRCLEFRAEVQNEFEELMISALTGIIDNLRDESLPVRDLSALNTVTDEGTLQHSSVDALPDTALFEALTTDKEYKSTRYDKQDPPDFQLVKISDGNKTLIGVQNHQSLTTYNQTKSGIPLLYENSSYSKFGGDLVIVPDSLNAVYFDGDVFVRSPKSFEKMFEMRDEYENRANTVFESFDEAGITFAQDKLTNEWLVGDIRVLRKLYAVHENEIPKFATPANMKELINKYEVSVEYKENGSGLVLDIERYQDIWKLLRVLNADYAEAEIIPDARLEINSKRIMDD